MSTTAPDNRITTYNPIVATTVFEALFPVFDNDDLSVFLDGNERTDFVVSATYVEGVSNDAKVTFASGLIGKVVVVGNREPHRTNRFGPGPIPVRDHNLALDTLESEVQEARRDIGRALLAPYGETPPDTAEIFDAAQTALDAAAAAEQSAEDAQSWAATVNLPSMSAANPLDILEVNPEKTGYRFRKPGVPTAGAKAEVLIKQSGSDYDTKWAVPNAINVTHHGIEPNTSSDKTAALQALLDSFGASGGILYFPPGSYPVNGLKLKNKVNGFNGTVLMGAGQGTQLVPFGVPDHLLRVEGARCVVRDLTLNAGGVSLRAAETATLWDGQPTIFENVAFLSATEHGLRNYDGDALMVRNCYFLSNQHWSIYSRNNMMNSTISGNFMQGGGVAVASAGQQCEGLRITDNTILNTNGIGVDVVNGLEIIIANNIIDQGIDSDVVIRNNASYVKILGNWLAGITAQSNSSVKLLSNANHIHIKDNTFDGGLENQIRMVSTNLGDINNVLIQGNTMRNMAANYTNIYAIRVARTLIHGNVISHQGSGDCVYWNSGQHGRISENIMSKAPTNDATAVAANNFGY